MPEPAVTVRGLRELQTAFAKADRDARLGLRAELRTVARPVQQEAQALALGTIRGMPQSPRWAGMRIGVTRTAVYVAPRQKGVRGGPKSRPNLAPLMMDRAMEPALDRNRDRIVHDFEHVLDTMADDFNHGGI
jgi:hypothetical protein